MYIIVYGVTNLILTFYSPELFIVFRLAEMHNMNKPFEPVFSVIQPNKPATKPKAVAMDTFPFSDKVTDENEKGNQNDTSLNLSDIPEKNKEISSENTYETSTDSGFVST